MEDWGEIKLAQIDSDVFWSLIDELYDDNSEFICNRTKILEAYTKGNLYGLEVNETDLMYNNNANNDDIFCKYSLYLLPCLCIKENNKAIIIWTHTRARRKGFAKKLVELLQIKYAYNPLPDSIHFWKKCNIKICN